MMWQAIARDISTSSSMLNGAIVLRTGNWSPRLSKESKKQSTKNVVIM